MATLPEGRVPLTDEDMVALLQNMAMQLRTKDKALAGDLNQTAERLNELANKAATRRHWTGHE